jgi:hypoxanthine phosphoribosyltransferase
MMRPEEWRMSDGLGSAVSPVSSPESALSPRFAHPVEEEFARLLDFYGVPWEYEPREFVLDRHEDGRPKRSFTPDFYLPQQDLYVELTTMNPRLTYRKTRKVRRLRELHPEIQIKLFDLRDVRALLLKYDRPLETIQVSEP